MTDRTRYRLTGAIFLLALAAIVLPMLFDGAGIEDGAVAPPDDVPDELMVEAAATPAGSFELGAPTLDEDALARAEELRESVDDEGFDRASGVRIGEPALRPEGSTSKAPIESWAVQVASFSEHANAEKFRDRLRSDGYAAFLAETKRGTGRSTRVAVGPLIERDAAGRLRDELATRYDAQAIVVRFEP
jgi:DedD protein